MALTIKQVEEVAYREPFEPYRVLLEGGEQIIVTKPRKAVVSGEHFALVGESHRPDRVRKTGLRIVPLTQLVGIESVGAKGDARASGRKRDR
jgi:hypothetical protein